MPDGNEQFRLMIVAGEPSGDAHAAALVNALRDAAPHIQFEFFGATGPSMRAAGVETIVNSDELAIMGIFEVGRVFPKFLRAFNELKHAASEKQADAVVLVDWPEFNLRLAKTLHRRGIRVVYYISPQVWAWRSYRVARIRRDIDLLLSILPFEANWFADRGVSQVEYVGHPLAGEVRPRYGREEFCRANDLDPARPVVALLPGSRQKELARILPPMLDAAALVTKQQPDVQFVVVIAPSLSLIEAKQIIANRKDGLELPQTLRLIDHEIREALAAADAAAIASGTATLEAGILGTPMVIVYKESLINWHTLGRLITTKHYGLVNLVAGERVAVELMQNDFNGERLAAEIISLLGVGRNKALRVQLQEVAARLGDGGASQRAAERVLEALREWSD
ncbi:MAG: lipid-A-disaccharide synthase [Cyanobacteria bacterium 13_1_40CM_2_61_4]|nr:MAG: lipid-A-disaccharide synthase [Cyanobacteria bacterium 13_1_40CM_2_61_4]